MNAVRAIRFGPGLAALAACLAIGAWCAASAPGYRQALDNVGRDAQLPLEQIAVASRDIAEPASAPPSERRIAISVHGRREAARPRASYRRRGFYRSIPDAKYWT